MLWTLYFLDTARIASYHSLFGSVIGGLYPETTCRLLITHYARLIVARCDK